MKLSAKQRWSIARAIARLNIWEGAVRSGKSYAAIYRYLLALAEPVKHLPPGTLDVIIAKTLGSLRRNVVEPIIGLLGEKSAKYYPGKQEFHIFDRVINVFGANDERSADKIRGSTIRKALGDEITLWPESFFRMLDTRLSLDESQFFGSTNPDAPGHYLKVDFLNRKRELNLASFHFTMDDNPSLKEAFKKAMKDNCPGMWYIRFIEGLWAIAEGAIYDFFTPDNNTFTYLPIATSRALTIDYGTVNPFGALLCGMNAMAKPKAWAEAECYYDSKKEGSLKTDSEYATYLIEFCSNKLGENWRTRLDYTIIDPSAASFEVELKKNNFPNVIHANNDVADGIRLKASMMKSGLYGVHESCTNYISEFLNYRWDSKSLTIDKPIKKFDHLQDAGRYFLATLFSEDAVNYDWVENIIY